MGRAITGAVTWAQQQEVGIRAWTDSPARATIYQERLYIWLGRREIMAPLAEAGITLLETTPKTELVGKRYDVPLVGALAGDSKLNQDILSIKGMSGLKYRMFINNLVEEMEFCAVS